jgi:hypothetical protein
MFIYIRSGALMKWEFEAQANLLISAAKGSHKRKKLRTQIN